MSILVKPSWHGGLCESADESPVRALSPSPFSFEKGRSSHSSLSKGIAVASIMHFLLGWPSTLQLPPLPPLSEQTPSNAAALPSSSPSPSAAAASPANGTNSSEHSPITEPIRSLVHNHSRTKTAVITDTAVYLFHFQQVREGEDEKKNKKRERNLWRGWMGSAKERRRD